MGQQHRSGRRRRRGLLVVGMVLTVPVAVVTARTVDAAALSRALRTGLDDPAGIGLALSAFGAAFVLRAVAWQRVLPGLGFGQALAALHVSLGANHVLPFRMGEPLRVASVVRRTDLGLAPAAASTVTLRTADVLAMGTLGLVVAPGAFTHLLGAWGWLAFGAVVGLGVFGAVWTVRIARARPGSVRLPGPGVALLTLSAWTLEAVLVWRAAGWAGIALTPADAVLVTSSAVAAQVLAITPSGFGTYEAAAVAAYSALGYDPRLGLAAALTAHALKTAYSLVGGAVGAFLPSPGLFGRLRLACPSVRPPASDVGPGPVVLLLPARDEAAVVAEVVRRAPRRVGDRDVVVLVVDDASTDATAHLAGEAGAIVVALPSHQGLGAAVRIGLRRAVEDLGAAAVAFCDADGEYAPEELAVLLAPIVAGKADYVVGSRFAGRIDHMRPQRRLGNRVLTVLVRFVARTPITDAQSGYRALSAAAATGAEIIHDFNYAQVLTLDLIAKGYRYTEVPISYRFRTTGTSFVRLVPYLRRVLPAIYRELNAPSARPSDVLAA